MGPGKPGRPRLISDTMLKEIVVRRQGGQDFNGIATAMKLKRKAAYNAYYKWLTRKSVYGDGFGCRTTPDASDRDDKPDPFNYSACRQ